MFAPQHHVLFIYHIFGRVNLSNFSVFNIVIKCNRDVLGMQTLWWRNSAQGVNNPSLSTDDSFFICLFLFCVSSGTSFSKLRGKADQQMECRWSRHVHDAIRYCNVVNFLKKKKKTLYFYAAKTKKDNFLCYSVISDIEAIHIAWV